MTTQARMPTVYCAHGGGPMPLLGMDDATASHLKSISAQAAARPKAIVVVTAHWEADPVRVSVRAEHEMLYDYYGFPEESYRFKYPAAGSPTVGARVRELLDSAGIPCEPDSSRGIDHGVFVPLMLAYPAADVPVVPLSLHPSLDPSLHLAIGAALAPLRDEGVLILGSGMSFHNMRGFDRSAGPKSPVGAEFDDALRVAVAAPATRDAALANWTSLAGARFSHPREEHLLPLHVVAGAARGESAKAIFDGPVLGAKVSAFRFGND